MMKPINCFILCLLTLMILSVDPQTGSTEEISLENRGLHVKIDSINGTISDITNRLTGEMYRVNSKPVSLETNLGQFQPSEVLGSRQTKAGWEFEYRANQLAISVLYHMKADQFYLEKSIEIKNEGTDTIVIEEIAPEDIQFKPSFKQIHPHRDPSQYAWLINLFLRSPKGGFYLGIENPFYSQLNEGTGNALGRSWIRLSYQPRLALAAGESYRTDPVFLGAYRNENIYVFKELGKLKQAVSDPETIAPERSFGAPGFNQTTLNFEQEVLDWGEVWAMQDFLRSIQPPIEFKRPGYYVRVVAMVGGRRTAQMGPGTGWHIAFGPEHVKGSKDFVDDIARLGHIPHIEWVTEWYGLGGYAKPTPGLQLEKAGPGDPVPVNPHWLEVVKHGWEKGLDIGLFETVSRDFLPGRLEWKVLKRDGTAWIKAPTDPPQHVNCWANPEYVKWRLEVTDRAVRDFRLYMVAWDSSYPACWTWLGWPNNKTECYANGHGHLPGDNRYQIFRNILWFLEELQARHPKVALRVAAGTIMDFPWIVKNLIEYHPSFFDGETGGSFWINRNFRFMPSYKSGILLSGTSDEKFKYLLLRSISSSDHFMMISDAVPVALNNKEFWDQWMDWADEHIDYLRLGRTLFREHWGDQILASLPPNLEGRLPATKGALHGSAHCQDNGGFIFLFNPTRQTRVGMIPINHWLGLTTGDRFDIKELYPGDGRKHGNYRRGEELKVAVGPETAMVLEIAPAQGDSKSDVIAIPAGAPIDKAFLTWEEIPWEEIMVR